MNLKNFIYGALVFAFLWILYAWTWPSSDNTQIVETTTDQTTSNGPSTSNHLPSRNQDSGKTTTKADSRNTHSTPATSQQNNTPSRDTTHIDIGLQNYNPLPSITKETTTVDHATCEKLKTAIMELVKNDPTFQEQGFWLTDPEAKDSIDYHSYTVDQLIPLAKNDDRNAQHVLGEKLALKDPTQAKHWLKEAAINGYTTSLISLSRATVNQYYQAKYKRASSKKTKVNTDQPSDNQKLEDYLVETLAWLIVVKKRLGSKDSIEEFHLENHQYTPEQIQAAKQLAAGFYEELEMERINRGLGHFKNHTFAFSQEQIEMFNQCSTLESK